ncbi:MAG: aminotransferase class V-fold PLP-dependent enzyme [Patescibacteria group bacterium]
MNINKIRLDFPLLQTRINGKSIIYFDNACQALRPWRVINAINDYYQKYSACGGRSVHKLGELVTRKCDESRKAIANFIGAKRKEEIIFTRNTTEGINLIARSFGLKKGDIVLTTDKEHNSNLIPWQILVESIGIIHKIVPSKKDNTFDLEKFSAMMTEQVKLVSMVWTSNLDGVTIPAREIISIAHKKGAKVLLDAAQTAPHQRIDVTMLDVDFLAFSGHKMLGPSGTGVLYGKYHLLQELDPFLVGGETVEYSTYENYKLLPPPEKFEAGLQDFAGILGLGEAVKYLQQIGFDNIQEHELKLNQYITEEISKLPKIKIIGPTDPALKSGIISFYIEGTDMHQIALMLDEMSNVMIRSGQHCVHSWFNDKQIKSSARVSLYFYNTMQDAEIFINSLNKIMKII